MAWMINYVYAMCVCDLNELRVFILSCVGMYEFDDLVNKGHRCMDREKEKQSRWCARSIVGKYNLTA